MSHLLIDSFHLKPMHIEVDDVPSNFEARQKKAEKKQKHGTIVSHDLGGKGYDYTVSQVNDNNFGLSAEIKVQFALAWVAPIFLDTID